MFGNSRKTVLVDPNKVGTRIPSGAKTYFIFYA